MKTVLFTLFLSLACLFTAQADNETVTTDTNRLPVVVRQFIHTHFPQVAISHLKIENNLLGVESYEVILTNGFDLEFDKKGAWKEIDGEHQTLPVSAIPVKIREYQQQHFPQLTVTSLKKESRGYEAQLSNGLEMKFDLQFNFIRLDD